MRTEDIIIIGAGPYGIGLACELRKLGHNPLILEKGDALASAWRARHPQLRLNTHRRNSGMLKRQLPRSAGRWPSRDDYVTYLEEIATDHNCRIQTLQNVVGINRGSGVWRLETETDTFCARQVIFATGFDKDPVLPKWEGIADFQGEIIHASKFGAVDQYRDKSVLVVGAGNSGVDVLNCLIGEELRSLSVSVRNGPVVVPAELCGFPLQLTGPILERIPDRMADLALRMTEKVAFGNLSALGLRSSRSNTSAASRLAKEFVAPAIDRGFVKAVKRKQVRIFPEIGHFDHDRVVFKSGESMAADIVICATGYNCGLDQIVGHLDVLGADDRPLCYDRPVLEGIWFALMPPPLGGSLRAISRTVQTLAHAISKEALAGRTLHQSLLQ